MRTRLVAALALSAALVLSGACGDDDEDDAGTGDTSQTTEETHELATFKSDLKGGAEEVPNPGDPDGSGTAEITIDQNTNEVCYEIKVENIAAPTASHIHQGAKGASGDILVTFDPTQIGKGKACVSAEHDVIDAIVSNPAGYYVNVHTDDFKGGAVRGQLVKS